MTGLAVCLGGRGGLCGSAGRALVGGGVLAACSRARLAASVGTVLENEPERGSTFSSEGRGEAERIVGLQGEAGRGLGGDAERIVGLEGEVGLGVVATAERDVLGITT